jgi:purine-nucleoside phosphorylase
MASTTEMDDVAPLGETESDNHESRSVAPRETRAETADRVTDTAAERTRQIHEASSFILNMLPEDYQTPSVGIICGSGLAYLGEMVENAVVIPYVDIPYFPASTVKGHGNKMVIGMLNGVVTVCLLGRFHIYEGHSLHDIALPVYVLADMKVESLVLTNSAGALNASFDIGDIMVIEDHISFVGLSGISPLKGDNLDEFGPRFPSMTTPYYEHSYDIALEACRCSTMPSGCRLQRGVYVGVGGPTFETRAELKFLTLIGGHAVGMSTTPEAICASHASLRVVALSLITNQCFARPMKSASAPSHEDVLSATDEYSKNMVHIVSHIVSELGNLKKA